MLKIIDDLKLKELKKYGIKKDKNLSDEFETIYSKREGYQTLCIDKTSKLIFLQEPFNSNTFFLNCDTLYDLIQAGLVEKVEG